MFALDRSFYIPKDAIKVEGHEGDAEVYVYQNTFGKPCALAFAGKAQKPLLNHSYADEAARDKAVEGVFASRRRLTAFKADMKASRQQASTLVVGDVLIALWGYEQTNVDFYEIVALKGSRSVVTRKIASETVRGHRDGGTCVAIKGKYIGEEETHLVAYGSNVRIDDVRRAHKRDGKPARWSDGH